MATRKKPRLYGDPATSLFSLLNNLRLKYKDHNKEKPTLRYVEIPDFGLIIKFSDTTVFNVSGYVGYSVMTYQLEHDEKVRLEFSESLMWHLISNGYMAYIRESEDGGNERIFMSLLVNGNWGNKILNKRLSDWSKRPEKSFLIRRTRSLMEKLSVHQIYSRFPDFFDYI